MVGDCIDKEKLMSTGQIGDKLSKFKILNKKKNIRNLNIKQIKFDWKHTDLKLGMKYNKKNL